MAKTLDEYLGITFDQARNEIDRACDVFARYFEVDHLKHLVKLAKDCDEGYVANRLIQTMIAVDAPREWQLTEEGFNYQVIEALSRKEALEEAKANVDRYDYPDAKGTIWIDVSVECELTGEEDSATVQLDEEEPDCLKGEDHNWQSPYELLGGMKENPGVWGKGGGVLIRKVCMHCGCEKVIDTWAQRPDNGEQGYITVSYNEGKYVDEIGELVSE
jgi:hypothetical protein